VSQHDLAVRMGPRRAGDPAAIVARAERISAVLGWKPNLADLDTIVGHALAWEKRLNEYRAAS
jgi:UDP-glucose 4-epimerase